MNIAVFGTGYVGLVSGVCLANTGKKVYCIDKNPDIIVAIQNGKVPIYEPGLEELLTQNKERIFPTTDAVPAILDSSVIMIAVGTPFDGKHIDLSYIKQAAKEIGQALRSTTHYTVVTVKSTVVPGTTEKTVKEIVLKESGKTEEEIGFCMNPEFLAEGHAVRDFNNPDRIVLGVSDQRAEKVMRKVYSGFKDSDILITNPTTAEMIKYTANSWLALNISYANEIARICETLNEVDSEEVFQGMFLDKRISPIVDGMRITPPFTSYLRAGCGFGGSCFPKDVKALAAFEKDQGVEGQLLEGLIKVNNFQLKHVFNLGLSNYTAGIPKTVAVLGTAFKPHTDDVRESPGIGLIKMALESGFDVQVHDCQALENTKKAFGDKVNYYEEPIKAMENADVIYVATIWDTYKEITDEDFCNYLKASAIVVDCRSLYKEREDKHWRVRVGLKKKGQKEEEDIYQLTNS